MTAAICRTANLLEGESGDLIVISERIIVINGSRSMAPPAALYISGNEPHSRPDETMLQRETHRRWRQKGRVRECVCGAGVASVFIKEASQPLGPVVHYDF